MWRSIALIAALGGTSAADTQYGLRPDGKVEIHKARCSELRALHAIQKVTDRDATITVGPERMSITIGKTTVPADKVDGDFGWWELDPEHRMSICVRPKGAHAEVEVQIAVIEQIGDSTCFEKWIGWGWKRQQP